MRYVRVAASTIFLLACAEATSGPPSLPFDTSSQCPGGDETCINEGVNSFEVDGLRVIHRRVEGHPLVALQLYFDALVAPTGMQLWSERLALDLLASGGPARLPYPQWLEQLAELSASVSATAGYDAPRIAALVPAPRWRALWKLLMEALLRPQLDGYSLDYYRSAYQYGFTRTGDEAETRAANEAYARLFRGEAYNLSNESSGALARVSLDDVTEAWNGLLTRERLLVVVVGDVTEQAARAAVREGLGWLPERHAPSFSEVELELGPEGRQVVLDYPDSPTWYLRSYFKGPAIDTREYAALRLGVSVLDRRLFDRVRDERGLAYTTGANLVFGRQTYFGLWLSTVDPRAALPIVREVLDELERDGPSTDELDAARSAMRRDALEGIDTPAGMAGVLANWALVAGDSRAVEDHFMDLEQASRGDVAEALNTYLRDAASAAAGIAVAVTEEELSALYEP